ncbi:MAG: hypothetical protein HYX92_12100 [Chloroflexi bacterium]|nr:hypothetical protein [Chloroflexota bacterium]
MRLAQRTVRPHEYFRSVPKINVLPREPRGAPPLLATRGALALALLAAAFLFQSSYQSKSAAEAAITSAETEARRVQQLLSVEQREVENIRAQLGEIKPPPPETGPLDVKWSEALSSLLDRGAPGVRFRAIEGKLGGEITVAVEAADARSLARFQVDLLEKNSLLETRNLSWQATKDSVILIATMRVKGP